MKIHIGKEIRAELRRQGKSVLWLATELHMQRPNVYRIFDSHSCDTEKLFQLSLILHTDFFALFSIVLNKDDNRINSDTEK